MTLTSRMAVLAAAGAAVFLTCGGSNPSSGDKHPPASTPQLRFHNSMQQTSILTGKVQLFRIRNLQAWDSTWSEEIEFDGYSASKRMVARDTAVTVIGERQPAEGGTWMPVTWTAHVDAGITGPLTVELSFGD